MLQDWSRRPRLIAGRKKDKNTQRWPQFFGGIFYWSRWFACATCDCVQKRCWPLLTVTFALMLRLSSVEVVIHWGRLLLRSFWSSSSIEIVFCRKKVQMYFERVQNYLNPTWNKSKTWGRASCLRTPFLWGLIPMMIDRNKGTLTLGRVSMSKLNICLHLYVEAYMPKIWSASHKALSKWSDIFPSTEMGLNGFC